MIIFPNAKVNIGLYIVKKRDDGFHDIESVFYPIPLYDMIEVIENREWQINQPKWQFQSEGIPIGGAPENNLMVKTYQLLDSVYDLPPVQLFLYKNIPMGAGLGGGSSDAAFLLRLLNQKFDLQMDSTLLKQHATVLGSDCTFFIDNQPAYLLGKGHEIVPYNLKLSGYYFVLICPPFFSSTALAYAQVIPRGESGIQLKQQLAQPDSKWKDTIRNDFESSVFTAFPELIQYKNALYESGAVYASMSGSGSSIFGLFHSEPNLPAWLKPHTKVNAKLNG